MEACGKGEHSSQADSFWEGTHMLLEIDPLTT